MPCNISVQITSRTHCLELYSLAVHCFSSRQLYRSILRRLPTVFPLSENAINKGTLRWQPRLCEHILKVSQQAVSRHSYGAKPKAWRSLLTCLEFLSLSQARNKRAGTVHVLGHGHAAVCIDSAGTRITPTQSSSPLSTSIKFKRRRGEGWEVRSM